MQAVHLVSAFVVFVAYAAGERSCPSDCSLAGACGSDGTCVCDPPFTGLDCATLNLGPARSGRALFRQNASSWGGSPIALRHATSGVRYFMYVATMANGCGLNSWTCNSQCAVAVADTPEGPYELAPGPAAVPAFCHNPSAHVTPDGKIVIFHIGSDTPHDGVLPMHCQSGNGSTDIPPDQLCKKKGTDEPHEVLRDGAFPAQRFAVGETISTNLPNIAYSSVDRPLGPFKELRSKEGWGANNPAVHIYPNGSVLLVAKFSCNTTVAPDPSTFCRQFGVFTATRWDAANWTFVRMLELFGEDPALFATERGLHMIADLRQYTPLAGPALNRSSAIHHAFSHNGLDWTINTKSFAVGGAVELRDGGALEVKRRERPHVLMSVPTFMPRSNSTIIDSSGVESSRASSRPLALFSAASMGNTHERGGDHTFTLVAPFAAL